MLPLSWQVAAARLAQAKLALGKVEEALALARAARESMRAQGGFGQRGTLVRLVYAEALEACGQREAARAGSPRRGTISRRGRRASTTKRRGRAYLTRVAENARVRALSEAWATRG